MEITLKKPEVETLRVNIGEGGFEIPLGNSLSFEEWKLIETFEGTVEFFKKHIPEKLINALTISEINQITAAWKQATHEQIGVNPGE